MKLDKTRKLWYLFLGDIWLLVSNIHLWRLDWALGCVTTQTWDIPNISKFPKILSLRLYGNLWVNSYAKVFILDIKSHFPYGKSSHCQNFVTFQNISQKIVRKFSFALKVFNNDSNFWM